MPTLKALAQLGKQALLAFVAQLFTEFATLKARVDELVAENAALRAQLEQRARDAKRQAAPFSKGQRKAHPKRPGRKPGQGRLTFRPPPRAGPLPEGPARGSSQTAGTQARPGTLHLSHPAEARSMDRSPDRRPFARA